VTRTSSSEGISVSMSGLSQQPDMVSLTSYIVVEVAIGLDQSELLHPSILLYR
jgi:hypothetical protein